MSTKDYSEVSAEKKKMRGPPAAKCSIFGFFKVSKNVAFGFFKVSKELQMEWMPMSTKDYSEVSAEKKKIRGPPAAKCSIFGFFKVSKALQMAMSKKYNPLNSAVTNKKSSTRRPKNVIFVSIGTKPTINKRK